jgi:hypothetical protein
VTLSLRVEKEMDGRENYFHFFGSRDEKDFPKESKIRAFLNYEQVAQFLKICNLF